MKPSDLVTLPVSLGTSGSVAPQPSLEEIIRQHYVGAFGEAGAAAADAYVERIRSIIDGVAKAAQEKDGPTFGPRPEAAAQAEPAAEPKVRTGPSGPDILETFGFKIEVGGHDVLEGMRKVGAGDRDALAPMLGGMLAAMLAQGARRKD